MQQKVLSGIKPTGRLTLGNYLSSLKHFKDYQETCTPYIFIADLHALTLPIDPKDLLNNTYNLISFYLASGLDPKKTVLFKQSDILEVSMLNSIIINYIYMGELSRMTQFKDKSRALDQKAIGVGLFAYPVLMAADLYMYETDLCPVGEDQTQHVELAREIMYRFNKRYKQNILKTPKTVVSTTAARIKNLQDPSVKMSKSDDSFLNKGVIYLDDDIAISKKKIMSAVTDNENKISYDKENKPGISNLLEIYASLKNISIEEAVIHFKDCQGYGAFKKEVSDALEQELVPLQEKFKLIRQDTAKLDEILKEGSKKATKIAKKVLLKVKKAVGLTM